jgi:hypothetical protein
MPNKRKEIEELYPELIFAEGYDDCIVGVVDRVGSQLYVCYDTFKILHKLEASGMSCQEADTFFEYNILGAFVGEHTPCFLEFIKGEQR